MHIVKRDDYKKRPGWDAVVRLGIDDCETYKNAGKSQFKWDGLTCDEKSIIKSVNGKPQIIPVFYAAYHEYGTNEVGSLSTFETGSRWVDEEAAQILVKLAAVLSNTAKVKAIYEDYENDRWSMGLDKVSEDDFNKSIAKLAFHRDELAASFKKAKEEREQKYKAENAAREKQAEEDNLASDREVNLVLWPNPTPEQRVIIDALHTVKFSIRNDGVVYANGRRFMSSAGMEYFMNSLNMTLSSCSDAGAYVGEKVISRACAQGVAMQVIEWGNTAKDNSISDRAWRMASIDGIISYNPLTYQIMFSHWAGMARVYTSRGF
jgi:hypothetical protein